MTYIFLAFSPDYQKGKIAAASIFKLLDRVPKILVSALVGKQPDNCSGDITFKGVEFNYPSRPQNKVLKGISFDIKRGQTVALVGSSGCGKTSITQLIERFYESNSGEMVFLLQITPFWINFQNLFWISLLIVKTFLIWIFHGFDLK